MLNGLKDYKNLCWNPSLRWLKKHWKGYVVFCVTFYALIAATVLVDFSKTKRMFRNKYIKVERKEES